MPESKCRAVYHKSDMKSAPFKFCQECGAIINAKLKPKEDCAKFHTLRKSKGYNYCPDCGAKL
jgi:hypothetical protein